MTRRTRRWKRRAIEWLKDLMASGGEIRIPEWMEDMSKFEFKKPCGGGNCQLCYLIGKKCVNEEEK